MEPIFRQDFEVTPLVTDCFGRLRPAGVLYFAQEAAGGHCRLLGVDWDTLSKRQLFWAVLRYRVEISRLPMLGEKITVETWPMPTTRTAFPRSTVAYDAEGNELFRCIGLWVLMDSQRRSMVLPGRSGIDLIGTSRGTELMVPGSLMPIAGEHVTARQVVYSELDRNLHMNNTRYMDWVADLLPGAFHKDRPVRAFTVCYLDEATEGQKVDLCWQLLDGPVLQVDAHREKTDVPGEKSRVFTASVEF
jgi:acyl-ACP thioesterase